MDIKQRRSGGGKKKKDPNAQVLQYCPNGDSLYNNHTINQLHLTMLGADVGSQESWLDSKLHHNLRTALS